MRSRIFQIEPLSRIQRAQFIGSFALDGNAFFAPLGHCALRAVQQLLMDDDEPAISGEVTIQLSHVGTRGFGEFERGQREFQSDVAIAVRLGLGGKLTEDPQHGTASQGPVAEFQFWRSSTRSFATASIQDSQSRCRVPARPGPAALDHRFRTKSFPGNCRTTRFISKLNSATLTVELGRPLARMTSSIVVSSSDLSAS